MVRTSEAIAAKSETQVPPKWGAAAPHHSHGQAECVLNCPDLSAVLEDFGLSGFALYAAGRGLLVLYP